MYSQDPIERWTKGCILPFPKKGNLTITYNYRGITLTPIAAKIYNLMILNRIRPYVYPILIKNQNGFRTNRSTPEQILAIRRIIEGVKAKNIPAILLFIDFSKALDSIDRAKMRSIIIHYGIQEETVNAFMMLYKNKRSMVRSPDGDTPFFKITKSVLQEDIIAPFLFIICLDYVLSNSLKDIENLGLIITECKCRRYRAARYIIY